MPTATLWEMLVSYLKIAELMTGDEAAEIANSTLTEMERLIEEHHKQSRGAEE